jgi:hypothetical protein
MSRNYSIVTNKNKHRKYNSEYCDDSMTFQDCELAILRHAVDESEKIQGQKIANSEDIKKMIQILETFLIEKRTICYGGTAINNILPKFAQFYNKDIEVPDYDFFSADALVHAKELADIYYKAGYIEVEAKSGVHHGTYKVFVNFIPIADITYLHHDIFDALLKDSITVAGIKYASPNFLRMSMYLELSRPAGDVSRWEKVLKRLILLNKYHPMNTIKKCNPVDFQKKLKSNSSRSEELYYIVRDSLIEQGAVFFGAYATSLYSKYMTKEKQAFFKKVPDFDVLTEDPQRFSLIVRERLAEKGFTDVNEVVHPEIGEIIPERIEIMVGKDSVAMLYYPVGCHNYNVIQIGNNEIKVATIDTMLSFYLAFIYAKEYVRYKDRILCMAKFLFDVEKHNRLEQKGILKRFSLSCIGSQPTLENIRAMKAEKFKELAKNRNSEEYQSWFLRYNPRDINENNIKNKNNKKSANNKKDKNSNKPLEDKEENEIESSVNSPLFSVKRKFKRVKGTKKKKTKPRANNRSEMGFLY